MGVINYIASIVSAHQRNKKLHSRNKEEKEKETKPDHTGFVPYTKGWKDKHYEWLNAGLCQMCGAPSGEEKGICDECRWG